MGYKSCSWPLQALQFIMASRNTLGTILTSLVLGIHLVWFYMLFMVSYGV